MIAMRDQVILAPHCDDAFLAMGGWIIQHSSVVKVVDLFATCAWTTSPETFTVKQLTEVNREEEARVAEEAGVALALYDYPEALLRGYRKWNTKRIHSADGSLSKSITDAIRREVGTAKRVFFPLAPGRHVDHVIIHNLLPALLEEFNGQGVEVYVYEDLPYSWYGGVDEQISRLSRRYTIGPEVIDVTDVFASKLNLLAHYKSQLASTDIQKVTEYAQSIVPGRYSERIWRVATL